MTQVRYALEPLTRSFRRARSLPQRLILDCCALLWQIPLKMLHPPNQPNTEIQIPWYKVKLKQIQVEFVTRDTEKSEFLDLVDLGV